MLHNFIDFHCMDNIVESSYIHEEYFHKQVVDNIVVMIFHLMLVDKMVADNQYCIQILKCVYNYHQ